MRRPSALASLILHLHQQAVNEQRVHVIDGTAERVIDLMRRGYRSRFYRWEEEMTEGTAAGIELRQGVARTEVARAVRQAAVSRLRNFSVFLLAVDTLGYSPQILRAALSIHWERLASATLGSDENCVKLDIEAALAQLDARAGSDTPRPSDVAALLCQGMGPQEIGVVYSTNGSRLVGGLLKQLSDALGGTRYE